MFKLLSAGLAGLALLLTLTSGVQAKHHAEEKRDLLGEIFNDKVIEAIEEDDYDEFKDELEDNTDDVIDSISEDDFEKVKEKYYRKKAEEAGHH